MVAGDEGYLNSYIPNDWNACFSCGTISPPHRLKDGMCIDVNWCAATWESGNRRSDAMKPRFGLSRFVTLAALRKARNKKGKR